MAVAWYGYYTLLWKENNNRTGSKKITIDIALNLSNIKVDCKARGRKKFPQARSAEEVTVGIEFTVTSSKFKC